MVVITSTFGCLVDTSLEVLFNSCFSTEDLEAEVINSSNLSLASKASEASFSLRFSVDNLAIAAISFSFSVEISLVLVNLCCSIGRLAVAAITCLSLGKLEGCCLVNLSCGCSVGGLVVAALTCLSLGKLGGCSLADLVFRLVGLLTVKG